MISPVPERRKHPRLEKNVPVKLCSDDFDVVTETRNISGNGAYCRVNRYFEPMAKLQIHLLLTFKKNGRAVTKKVSCQGIVVRVEAQPGGEYFNIAIYFNEINKRDAKYLEEYVSSSLIAK